MFGTPTTTLFAFLVNDSRENVKNVYRKMIRLKKNHSKAFMPPREVKDNILKSTYLTFRENKLLEIL